jgi:hypothetical protein
MAATQSLCLACGQRFERFVPLFDLKWLTQLISFRINDWLNAGGKHSVVVVIMFWRLSPK